MAAGRHHRWRVVAATAPWLLAGTLVAIAALRPGTPSHGTPLDLDATAEPSPGPTQPATVEDRPTPGTGGTPAIPTVAPGPTADAVAPVLLAARRAVGAVPLDDRGTVTGGVWPLQAALLEVRQLDAEHAVAVVVVDVLLADEGTWRGPELRTVAVPLRGPQWRVAGDPWPVSTPARIAPSGRATGTPLPLDDPPDDLLEALARAGWAVSAVTGGHTLGEGLVALTVTATAPTAPTPRTHTVWFVRTPDGATLLGEPTDHACDPTDRPESPCPT